MVQIGITGENATHISIKNGNGRRVVYSISCTLILGRIGRENADSTFDLGEQLRQEEFVKNSSRLVPLFRKFIFEHFRAIELENLSRDQLNVLYNFKDEMMGFANDILVKYNMKPRIKDVLINSFVVSDKVTHEQAEEEYANILKACNKIPTPPEHKERKRGT